MARRVSVTAALSEGVVGQGSGWAVAAKERALHKVMARAARRKAELFIVDLLLGSAEKFLTEGLHCKFVTPSSAAVTSKYYVRFQ